MTAWLRWVCEKHQDRPWGGGAGAPCPVCQLEMTADERDRSMTLLSNHPSKKDLKASVGKPLRYTETSFIGEEYRANGWLTVAGRPAYSPDIKREYSARVLMENDRIKEVK